MKTGWLLMLKLPKNNNKGVDDDYSSLLHHYNNSKKSYCVYVKGKIYKFDVCFIIENLIFLYRMK